jgi:hypothetical protein
VISELPDNAGTSVTNAAEIIAELLCERYNLAPAHTLFIEHYPDRRERLRDGTPDPMDVTGAESFDLVTFGGVSREGVNWTLGTPGWKRLAREQVERWTGRVWEPEAYPK